MKIYSTAVIAGAVLTTLFAFSAFAIDHRVLNGTWTLTPAKSDFAGQAVLQTGTVTISDNQGIIIVERSFVYETALDDNDSLVIGDGHRAGLNDGHLR